MLFATGYLTDAGEIHNGIHRLVIPNREVLAIYEKKISTWFQLKVLRNKSDWKRFCAAFKEGDAEMVQNLFNEFMAESISIRDTFVKKEMKENFYHGLLLGLLRVEGSWIVKSNVESGIGYTDICIRVPSGKNGCVIEVKYAENGKFDSACQEAMRQIDDGRYADVLKQEGMETVHKYAIACYKKSCRIEYGRC